MARLLPQVPQPIARALASLALLALATGCTSESDPGVDASRPSEARTLAPPLVSETAYVFTDEAGIEARLTLMPSGATLSIVNRTGESLPPPGLYALDARDGTRVGWKVLEAAPVPTGTTVRFDVRRPDGSNAQAIGLVAMLFGGEDLGAFVPPQPAGGAVP